MEENNFNRNSNEAGGTAIACLILGIVSAAGAFLPGFSVIGLICGIIGLICASVAKNEGDNSGVRTAGFICSLVGVIGCGISVLACVACLSCLGASGRASGYDIMSELEDLRDSFY